MTRLNLNQLAMDAYTMRRSILNKMFDPRRDIDTECGYPKADPSAHDFRRMYDREGVASRVCKLYPQESWARDLTIKENEECDDTDFERAFKSFQRKHNILHYMRRADVMSGIGRFGVIMFGLDDNKRLEEPVEGSNEDGTWNETPTEKEVTFIRVFDESLIDIASYETDETNPRFGQPKFYNITFEDPRNQPHGTGSQPMKQTQSKVHWTRCVHLADNRTSSEIVGSSRQLVVWNRLLDCRKIQGGTGEMWWRGAFPGISLESQQNEDIDFDSLDFSETREDLEMYMNGLQRYLINVGMNAKSLAPQIASPEHHFKITIMGIAIPLCCPYRVFMGSEQASMASDQDISTWRERMNGRNDDYTNPMVVQPIVQRLIDFGVLPKPDKPDDGLDAGYFAGDFPDLNAPSDKEKIENMSKIVEAMAKYVQSGMAELIPEREFLTLIMDMSQAQADNIMEAAEGRIEEEEAAQAAMEERLAARVEADPNMRLTPPEGAERIPEPSPVDPNRLPTNT